MRVQLSFVVCSVLIACASGNPGSPSIVPPGPDAGVTPQPTPDSGPVSPPPVIDAGTPNETIDAGTPDAGAPDAGPTSLKPGGLGQGPFPMDSMFVYGPSQGLDEPPVSASVDEASNLWVVSTEALYLLTPGSSHFRKYTAADGLHLGPGYTEPPDITLVEGGKPNECFVGYYFHDTSSLGKIAHTDQDPAAHMGKMDQVLLQPDGTLQVNRYDFHNTNLWTAYETRVVTSMVYDHFQHPHTLYVGSSHGVIMVLPDRYMPPLPGESIDSYWWRAEKKFYGDHLHPVACLNGNCDIPTFGDFFGLTLADDGRLWMGGLASAGAVHYVAPNSNPEGALWDWMQVRTNPFTPSIGYDSTFAIWNVPYMGAPINLRGVAVTPDGTVWFASGEVESWRGPTYGLASLYNDKYSYYNPETLGAAEYNILEIQALNDGRIVLGFPNSGLLVYTPGDAKGHRITSAQGLPGEQIGRMSQDKLHDPPILFVPTNGGLAAFRSVP
jgi:hypothetical protein